MKPLLLPLVVLLLAGCTEAPPRVTTSAEGLPVAPEAHGEDVPLRLSWVRAGGAWRVQGANCVTGPIVGNLSAVLEASWPGTVHTRPTRGGVAVLVEPQEPLGVDRAGVLRLAWTGPGASWEPATCTLA